MRLPTAIAAAAIAALPALALPTLAAARGSEPISAVINGTGGEEIGQISVAYTPSGYVHVVVSATGIPAGTHAIHFHETGVCEGDFESAGGHIAGDMEHGILVEGGPHPGDLPNAVVQDDGLLAEDEFNDRLTQETLNDADGSAFIIHAGADDYESQPSGDAGGRIGCAVIYPPS